MWWWWLYFDRLTVNIHGINKGIRVRSSCKAGARLSVESLDICTATVCPSVPIGLCVVFSEFLTFLSAEGMSQPWVTVFLESSEEDIVHREMLSARNTSDVIVFLLGLETDSISPQVVLLYGYSDRRTVINID